MAKIHVLEKHIAELIAAGEVVERPASVVKELLENSIDAGATQIAIAIESGGIRLIEITDNGTGIETEYIDTAFIRHATSKIQNEDDLNSIATLGFRGEALASIASVARVEVLTKTEDDEFACSYRVEGGESLGLEVSARAVGTTIRVRDLFYNTPARMKFLKKDASEGTFAADVISHVALSHPEISFKFVREGKLQYVTPGDGDLQSAAYAVLGREFARDLVKVADVSGNYAVDGYVSPPKNCRASRSMQYFYINGRYVKNRTMMAALETAYKGTLMHGKFPGCVLSLQMPVDLIDVNVHPAKTEVRFAREKDVFEAVYRAVKGALAQATNDARLFTFEHEQQTQATPTKPQVKAANPWQITREDAKASNDSDILTSIKRDDFTEKAETFESVSEPFASAVAQAKPSVAQSQPAFTQKVTASSVVAASAPIASQVQLHSPSLEGVEAHATHVTTEQKVARSAVLDAEPVEPIVQPAFTPTKMNEAVLDIVPEVQVQAEVQSETFVQGEQVSVQEPVQEDLLASEQFTSGASSPDTEPSQTMLYPTQEEPLRYVGEIFKTYILAQRGEVLCMIDKHAAHERMLYESLAETYGNVASQMLLEAVAVNLSAAEKQALLENVDLLEQAGLEIDDFGGTTVLVRAVPADIVVTDVESLTVELAAKLANGARDAFSEKTEWVLHSISCRAAIKAGDQTDAKQLMHLAQRILSGEIPQYCPHGRPCVITLTRKELEKQFGRIV